MQRSCYWSILCHCLRRAPRLLVPGFCCLIRDVQTQVKSKPTSHPSNFGIKLLQSTLLGRTGSSKQDSGLISGDPDAPGFQRRTSLNLSCTHAGWIPCHCRQLHSACGRDLQQRFAEANHGGLLDIDGGVICGKSESPLEEGTRQEATAT